MNAYFTRYASQDRFLESRPHPDTAIVITIPAYNEPQLNSAIESLRNCHPINYHTEVIILNNYPESNPSPAHSQPELHDLPDMTFHYLNKPLPDKKAGVGFARKLIMDEAAWRLSMIGCMEGLIVGLDADCTVAPDYLRALSNFMDSPYAGASIYYEHPVKNESPEIQMAITEYELHLRYYVHAQRWAGAEHAFQTVGSSMVVRNRTYQAVGGMNLRKAGEDFYFLQKVMPHGFTEIRDTTVFPSPRKSDRVPFGTGKAVAERLLSDKSRTTYSPNSFILLQKLYTQKKCFFDRSEVQLPDLVNAFFDSVNGWDEIDRIRSISSNASTFEKHFHTWFDGFLLMKSLHFFREKGIPDIPVNEAAAWLIGTLGAAHNKSISGQLDFFRKLDRKV